MRIKLLWELPENEANPADGSSVGHVPFFRNTFAAMQFAAIPAFFLCYFIFPDVIQKLNSNTTLVSMIAVMAGFFAMMMAHEFIHLLFMGGSIFHPSATIYIAPRYVACLAFTEVPMKRNRAMLATIAPLLLLSALPWSLLAFGVDLPWFISLVAIGNATMSTADFFVFVRLFQVPAGAGYLTNISDRGISYTK